MCALCLCLLQVEAKFLIRKILFQSVDMFGTLTFRFASHRLLDRRLTRAPLQAPAPASSR